LSGCNNNESGKPEIKDKDVGSDKIRIGMSFDSFVIERWQRDRDVFVATARELGAEVNVQSANGEVAEQFNKTFDFYQVLPNMPAGQYIYSVQAFYRDGSKTVALANYGTSGQQQNA
jgi:hypothetical protein